MLSYEKRRGNTRLFCAFNAVRVGQLSAGSIASCAPAKWRGA